MSRILGVDYGDSRIGLALSDPLKIIASPYKTIPNKGWDSALESIIQEEEIEKNGTLYKWKNKKLHITLY